MSALGWLEALALSFVVATAVGCGSNALDDIDGGVPQDAMCVTELVAVSAVSGTVVDDVTGAMLCDGTVVVTYSNNASQTLVEHACDYFGAFEQSGTLVLTATHAGYASATETVVIEEGGDCHVIPQTSL